MKADTLLPSSGFLVTVSRDSCLATTRGFRCCVSWASVFSPLHFCVHRERWLTILLHTSHQKVRGQPTPKPATFIEWSPTYLPSLITRRRGDQDIEPSLATLCTGPQIKHMGVGRPPCMRCRQSLKEFPTSFQKLLQNAAIIEIMDSTHTQRKVL